MSRRSSSQRQARERIQQLAAAGLNPERLASELVVAVQAVVPGDGYRLFGLDPATWLINRLLAASEDDGWARLEWLRDCYLAGDLLNYREHHHLLRLRLPAVAIHADQQICWGYPSDVLSQLPAREHERIFHEIQSPAGRALMAHFADGGRWIAALQLYRREAARPFVSEDVTFLRQISPPIGQALGAALSRERALAARDSPGATGIVLLSPDRRVTFSTPAGETWLRRLHDADRDGHAPLPTALWAATAGLRAGDSVASVVTVATAEEPLRIEASRAGPDGSLAVVLAPPQPPEQPAIPTSWNLTASEQRVVSLLVRGLTNREIATTLSVSENTVEFHLRHVYDKLDVRSRSEVVSRFFRETYWPGTAANASECDDSRNEHP